MASSATRSRTSALPGATDEASYIGRLDYEADRYGLRLEHLYVGEDFDPDIGFLRRSAFRRSFGKARFSPRPASIEFVRKFLWEATLDYITDPEGRLETRLQQGAFEIEFESADRLTLELSDYYEFLAEPFDIAEGVVIPIGGYDFRDARVSYQFGAGQVLWEQPVADCNPGTVAVEPHDVDFAFDAQNPAVSTIHVLGYCDAGIVGLSNDFLQSFDLDGGLLQQRRFNPDLANFPLLARHKVGGGAWLYEYAPETGGDGHLLQIADAQHGLYPLFWPEIQGDVAVDSQGQSALIRAASAAAPAHYFVADLQRSPGGLFEVDNTRLYKGLSAHAGNGMRWSSDGQGNRVAVYRSGPAGSLSLAGYGQDTEPQWLRSLDAIGATAQPQLRYEAASGEFVLAVDRTRNGSSGVYLTQFAALDSGPCAPPFACLADPDLP